MNHQDHSCDSITPLYTRRDILRNVSCGFGWLAFAGIAQQAAAAVTTAGAPESPLAPKAPHFKARAKRVIFLTMRGGPSHVDTFDYKPQLTADTGKSGKRPGTQLLGSKWKFAQSGRSGLWISEAFRMWHNTPMSSASCGACRPISRAIRKLSLKLHTGSFQFVRPSLGAWTLYGLGTENQNLPGFITLTPPSAFGGAQNYGSAFLPAIYQAQRIGADNRPVAQAEVKNLSAPMSTQAQRNELELVQALNREKLARDRFNPEVEGVIQSYELAFKMQSQMPEVMDVAKESAATQKLYGIGDPATDDFGRKCLLARRCVEAGVRFVEISHGNWDQHFNLTNALANNARAVDLPIAGLLTDLRSRGLLKDTLVVWAGEFGRTPHAQGGDGRDHNNKAFTIWMAGGGVKGGFSHGQTDEYGYEAVEDKVQIHDLHATILAFLGLDHEKLTFNYAGRDFRLTDVHGEVVKAIMA